MKNVPMILFLITPWAVLAACGLLNMDLTIGIWIYSVVMLFNVIYAFWMPRLGCGAQQILLWNLLLKLCHLPLIGLILLVTLMMTLIGGKGMTDEAPSMILIALALCYALQLSSSLFGISGFRWCRKYGTMSKAGMVASSIVQFIPVADVIGSILCYIMFRKEGQPKG